MDAETQAARTSKPGSSINGFLASMPKRRFMKVSIIITTYNNLDQLRVVVKSLCAQQEPGDMEVLIADDGSTHETADWLQKQTTPFPIRHIWQPNEGFRAAKIRNVAVAKASGDYLIFIDGDCVLPSRFIQRHKQLAQKKYFVTGNRILLNPHFTQQILAQDLSIYQWHFPQWFLMRLQGKCNRIIPLCPLPRILRRFGIYYSKRNWHGAKTCNLALWYDDFISVNGFDERYQGWGYEDSDLVIRLMRSGITRKNVKLSLSILHLWHTSNDRSRLSANRSLLETVLKNKEVVAEKGVGQYLT